MRQGVFRLKDIKVVRKANGRRYVYRRVGKSLVPLPDLPENDPDFLQAYAAAATAKLKRIGKHPPGSIAALCEAYLASKDFQNGMSAGSQEQKRHQVNGISADRGAGLVRDLRADHLKKDLRKFTQGAAANRWKGWRTLLKFAVEENWISADPSYGMTAPKGKTKPHREWTRGEIEAYRAHWLIGTPQRLAFEVIYWTGARCVDAARLGWQMVDKEGWLGFVQEKTGGPATCPIKGPLPSWCRESFAADQAHLLACLPSDRLQWIVTQAGNPRSVDALSKWMSANAKKAGLADDCTAHGLRKARASALAEAGATTSQIGAWTGHETLTEIAHYTRGSDKRRLLRGAEQAQKLETGFGNSEILPLKPQENKGSARNGVNRTG